MPIAFHPIFSLASLTVTSSRRDDGFAAVVCWGIVAGATIWFVWLFARKAMRAVERRRDLAVLGYVEQAVRLKVPLPEFLMAAALGEQAAVRDRLLAVHGNLVRGSTIAEAIDNAAPALPTRAMELTAAGERSGRLASTLRQLIDGGRSDFHGDIPTSFYFRYYPVLMLLAVCGVFLILSIYVMPKYQDILGGFGMPMPALTRWTIAVGNLAGPLLTVLLASCVALWLVRGMFLPHSGAMDAIVWRLPIFGQALRDRALADVAEVTADALSAGRPTNEAVSEAAGLKLHGRLKEQVRQWWDAVSVGRPLHDAAREANLPRLFADVLAIAAPSGDVVDALGFLERHYRTRFSRTAAILEAALVPAMVLFFGACVTLAALGMFLPMIELINILSPYSEGI